MPQVIAMMNKEMLYYINPEQQTPEELKALLEMHPEIKFVSFPGHSLYILAFFRPFRLIFVLWRPKSRSATCVIILNACERDKCVPFVFPVKI